MYKNEKKIIFLLVLFLYFCGLLANDTRVSDRGGNIIFLKENDIKIKKEVLTIQIKTVDKGSEQEHDVVDIKVDYLMKNEGKNSKNIEVAFPLPEMTLEEYHADAGRPNLRYEVTAGCHKESRKSRTDPCLLVDRPIPMKLLVNKKKISGEWKELFFFKGKQILIGKKLADLPMPSIQGYCDNQKIIDALEKDYATCQTISTDPPSCLDQRCTEKNKEFCRFLVKETGAKNCFIAAKQVTVTLYFQWTGRFPAGQKIEVSHEYQLLPTLGYYRENVPSQLLWSKNVLGIKSPSDPFCTLDMKEEFKKIENLKSQTEKGRFEGWPTVEYLLTSGKNWKESIEDFTLVIKKDRKERFISTCFPYLKKRDELTFVSHITHFVPQGDLAILFSFNEKFWKNIKSKK